jgi:hypothetical protein
VHLHSLFVEIFGFTFLDSDCILRAFTQTRSETVAQVFSKELRFAVNDLEGTFCARRNADTAAIAFLFVNMDNLPQCHAFIPRLKQYERSFPYMWIPTLCRLR